MLADSLPRLAFAVALAAAATFAPAATALAAGGGGGGSEKRITSAESYLPLNGLSATLMQDFAPTGLLIVDFGLDIPDAALRQRAQRMLPRLRDAGRAAVAEYAHAHHPRGQAPDPDRLTQILQRHVDRTLGASGAQVLLANLMVQSAR